MKIKLNNSIKKRLLIICLFLPLLLISLKISASESSFKVTISEDCCGCGVCVAVYPALFVVEDGKAKLTRTPVYSTDIDGVGDAEVQCPREAISHTEP